MSSRLPSSKKSKPKIHALLGVGLDGSDGHKRVTKGEKFAIVGGSAETHERMTEGVVKTMERLHRKGKELEEAEPGEIAELLRESLPGKK
ncbi:MAG TPA: hypothetical protein VK737_05380 [Opitutales bacterium]|jgi:hypothetical protein|nr:hypothetical protein [Opitutales bacterium]